MLGLGDHTSLCVKERRRAVAPLFDVRGVGAPDEDRPHLLGDAGQGARQDREGYRVQPSVAHLFSSTSVPTPSTAPRQPGRTTQVDSLNSTIAGPSTPEPLPIRSRSSTGTSIHSPPKLASRRPFSALPSGCSGSSSSGFSTGTVAMRRRFTSSTGSSS